MNLEILVLAPSGPCVSVHTSLQVSEFGHDYVIKLCII